MEVVCTEFEKLFNSLFTEFFKGRNIEELIQRKFVHIRMQLVNPEIPDSGFTMDQIIHQHINSHKLVLRRGSTYIELSIWIARKKAVINPKSNNEQYFK